VPYYRDEKIIKDFGKTIKKYRLLIGISQEELADRSELDLTQIGRI
jgi:transcriptional regulator with XRE-family HTH domain